jgi:glucose/arabinose dehydrogenase
MVLAGFLVITGQHIQQNIKLGFIWLTLQKLAMLKKEFTDMGFSNVLRKKYRGPAAVINSRAQIVLLLLITCMKFSAYSQSGASVYKTYCSGCHGSALQGSSATALIKNDWKHGSDRNSIIKSISNGIPGTEMARFSITLSAKDIEAVADFIVKAQNPKGRNSAANRNSGKAQNAAAKTAATTRSTTLVTKLYNLNVDKLVTAGIKTPMGIEFVDTKTALISGRTGELRWMVNGKLDPKPITGLPKTYGLDLVGGYMDIALDPDYSKNGWIYLSFSHNPGNSTDKNTPGMTKIVRGRIQNHQWINEQTLFEVNDSLNVTGGTRWGCRFLFDKEGFLYFTIGDMNRAEDSQILSRPSGKVYRINRDGSIPKDNPLYGRENCLWAIYSWGNRNVQGLAQHPQTGLIYASEHGPKGGDELNILKKGANYGWPVITYGIDYSGKIITNDTAKQGMEQPITYWTPSIAVCALEFVKGNRFPKWQNNLLVTALAFQELRRLVIDGSKVLEQEILMKGQGRVRDVKLGPDGALYVLTNDPDEVLRITPQ